MSNTKNDRKPLIVAIAAFIIALAGAGIALFDNDPNTQPDYGAVIDAGTEVYEVITDKPEIPADE